MSRKLDVLYVTTVPAPYKVALFEEMGKAVNLTVLFETASLSYRDQKWFDTTASHFEPLYMRGIKVGDRMISTDGVSLVRSRHLDAIIIGAYSTVSEMLLQQYLQLKGIPYILSSDGGFISHDSCMRKNIKRHFIGNASHWLSTSSLTTDYLVHYGANPKRVYKYPFSSVRESQVLSEPIGMSRKKALRDRFGLPSKNVVLSIGQIIPRKGMDLLVKAAERLPEVTFCIVGGSPSDELTALQRGLGVNNVQYFDFTSTKDLALYYAAADVFALATREDVWGLVVNEAMAFGLPVITTERCGAGLEMVDDGRTGSLVPINDVNALANSIAYWLDRAGAAVSELVLETARDYTIEAMAGHHLDAISRIVSGD